eukprot:2261729-Pyramimonas_sp.AAC.1
MAEKHRGEAFGPASPWDKSAASAAGPGSRGGLRHRDVFPLPIPAGAARPPPAPGSRRSARRAGYRLHREDR